MCPRAGRAGVAAARSAMVATVTIVWVALARRGGGDRFAGRPDERNRIKDPTRTSQQLPDSVWTASGRPPDVSSRSTKVG
jgi:hypothetical protein